MSRRSFAVWLPRLTSWILSRSKTSTFATAITDEGTEHSMTVYFHALTAEDGPAEFRVIE
jgi:hypothetical protein